MKTCHWHKCCEPFEPNNNRQKYCSAECRKKWSEWAKARGINVVSVVTGPADGVVDGVMKARKKLLAEIDQARLEHKSNDG
jgi:hypothetical protein